MSESPVDAVAARAAKAAGLGSVMGARSARRGHLHIANVPARIAGLGDRGTLAPGLRADLVAVDAFGGTPIVRQTWIADIQAFGARPALPAIAR